MAGTELSQVANPPQDEEALRANELNGMNLAFFHAVDMNRNGELDEKELEEFRRYIIGLAVDLLPMQEYAAMRGENGEGHNYGGELHYYAHESRLPDGVSQHDGKNAREAIARKIAANFINQMYESGHVDDETYATEMQKLGITDAKERAAGQKKWEAGGEEPPIGDGAVNVCSEGTNVQVYQCTRCQHLGFYVLVHGRLRPWP